MKKRFNFKEKNIIVCFLCMTIVMSLSLFTYYTVKKERIKITIKGQELIVDSYRKTVKDVLNENDIVYDNDDIIEPNLESNVNDYMKINVIDVKKITISEHERIAFETKTIEDDKLTKGINLITQKGKEGKKLVTYEVVYHDGKLENKELKHEVIKEEPIKEVIKKGTSNKIIANTATNNNSITKVNGRRMTVSATAYSGGGITATGTNARWGTIAVDPRIIPYGTRVYIPQFNMTFVAEDCGGGIKGNKIDIYMNSSSQCYNWGVRTIEVYVVG